MATTSNENDRLQTQPKAFSVGFAWKDSYVESLQEDGLERFAQFSATPDTTLMYAGPARFTALDPADLMPIGLTDNVALSSNPSLARLFEIGSNRSFFTRGKSTHSMQLTRMLADQNNVLEALSKNAYRPQISDKGMAGPGAESPNPAIKMNLESEYFDVPFGILLLFKTRGGGNDGTGKPLTALYAEYCMFASYQFGINSQAPVIQENVAIEFDRIVPVSLN